MLKLAADAVLSSTNSKLIDLKLQICKSLYETYPVRKQVQIEKCFITSLQNVFVFQQIVQRWRIIKHISVVNQPAILVLSQIVNNLAPSCISLVCCMTFICE